MTEAEWLACRDPEKMFEFLQDQPCGRKGLLFAAACCHRLLPLLGEPDFTIGTVKNKLISFLEKMDRDAGGPLPGLWLPALEVWYPGEEFDPLIRNVWQAVAYAFGAGTWDRAEAAAYHCAQAFAAFRAFPSSLTDPSLEGLPNEVLCRFLREVLGNPFHPVGIEPSVLIWNDSTVPRLAQVIYDERAFDRLPILADALEDAGCNNADILGHCRGSGEHVRGCWVVDLLLGKD
jgi:hypothetical protein